ncbi:MAG: putative bifunctional diguanylate cyclase/phosphodiesterase, partial [Actinomycetes bacterium]
MQSINSERAAREDAEQQAAEVARLLAELRERAAVMNQIEKIQRDISLRRPTRSILDKITSSVATYLRADAAGLFLFDDTNDERGRLISTAGNFDFDELDTAAADPSHPARIAQQTDGTVMLETDASPIPGSDDSWAAETTVSVLAAPVHRNGSAVGALVLQTLAGGGEFGAESVKIAETFAECASLALNDENAQAELTHKADYDALTELPNRRKVTAELARLLDAARLSPVAHPVTVLFIDLDRFKQVNDAHGHAVGDQLLRGVAERLRRHVRDQDIVGRLAGDEFVLIVDGRGLRDGQQLAQRLIDELKAPLEVGSRVLTPSISVGVAEASPNDDAEAVLSSADLAMYRAKQLGRGRVETFDQSLREISQKRASAETDLRRAISAGEFAVFFQPSVRLLDRRVVGVEALVRWIHPERGVITPDEFIPVAEETGAITEIDTFVLREACRQVAEWGRSDEAFADMSLSVNMSARQFTDPKLVATVRDALQASGLRAEQLYLEITERVMMEDGTSTTAIAGLGELGVRLAVDDFGTGYSSLR